MISWLTGTAAMRSHQPFGAFVEVLGIRGLDGQPPLGSLCAGDAITGQQKAFRALVAEPVRPQPGCRHTPDPGRRIADLRVGCGDHLVGVQRDIGAAGHAVAVDLATVGLSACIRLEKPRTNRLIIW